MTPEQIADLIFTSREDRVAISAPSVRILDSQAYQIQWLNSRKRLDAGEVIIGWKLGYVSAVMRKAMGITEPNYAPLWKSSFLPNGGVIPETVIAPMIEPEIAVMVGENQRIESMMLSLEIVDSVWQDYTFTWAHNTADWSSSAYAVVGPERETCDVIDFGDIHGEKETWIHRESDLDINASISWLSEALRAAPRPLLPGDIVLTGGLLKPIAFPRGSTIAARVDFAPGEDCASTVSISRGR